ncbi:magnesium-dependent phosphatase 1-like, partial [Watersipora subatra]|uniref:magnesium-dependent phosphatase 1-like n=1 Tax=Watersipora subatra TaxID=2589382 RepID=UPI00355BA668
YPDSPLILQTLSSERYELAVASRSDTPDCVRSILKLLGWEKYFSYTQIYPGTKTVHLEQWQTDKAVRWRFQYYAYFDDEMRNISDMSNLGKLTVQE